MTPSQDVKGMNNNRKDDINLGDLKNNFDVLAEQDSVLEPVTDNTCKPTYSPSSSSTQPPSTMKSTPIVEKI